MPRIRITKHLNRRNYLGLDNRMAEEVKPVGDVQKRIKNGTMTSRRVVTEKNDETKGAAAKARGKWDL